VTVVPHVLLVGATGAVLRTAMFEDRPHLVVPVVALIGDSVVWAVNSAGPELVPADEVEVSVPEWCGRPVVGDHPRVNGSYVSANPPEVAERVAFGRIANPRYENRRLLLEAWLDRERARQVGAEAVDVVARAEAGEPIEVSVGVRVAVEHVEGVAPDGQSYVGVWHDLGSDHLAMLPRGAVGACSNEAGCGAPRVARRHLVAAGGLQLIAEEDTVRKDDKGKTLRERLRSLLGGAAHLDLFRFRGAAEDDGVSDMELRQALDRALFSEEPGYLGIDAVFPTEKLVVYAVAPEQQVVLYRRGFELSADGAVSLASEKEQVEPVTNYQAVKAAQGAPPAEVKAACSCQHSAGTGAQESDMSKIAERVTALIKNERSPFEESDRKRLESFTEEHLTALEASFAEPTPTPSPSPTPSPTPATTPTPKAKGEGEEEELVTLKASELSTLRQLASAEEQRRALRKTELVAVLKGKQKVYSEDELRALDLTQLERVAQLVNASTPPSLAGKVLPSATDGVPPPPSMGKVARDMRATQ
jgi:hypothetical protein